MTISIALIGAGSVGRRHAGVLNSLPGVRLASITDAHEPAAQALADELDLPAFTSPDEALDAVDVDAVYVCVPPFAHGPGERAALSRGLPLFVEKPVGLGRDVAEEIGALVEERGVVTGTGYHWRCMDSVEHARRLLADAPPLLANGYWLDKRPPVPWWGRMDRSGGQVVEQLTHVLDTARFLLGEAVEVYAAGLRRGLEDPDPSGRVPTPEDYEEVDDATAATVRFASGTVATLAATSVLAAKHRAALHTVSRGLYLELSEDGLSSFDGSARTDIKCGEDPRIAVDREFIEAVRGERESTRVPYAEALRSHRLACAIAESARTGRPVKLQPEAAPELRADLRPEPEPVRPSAILLTGLPAAGQAADPRSLTAMNRRRNLIVAAAGNVEIVDEALPEVPDGGVLLETLATGLSAGTELAFVKGSHPGLSSRLDPELSLFVTGSPGTGYPVRRLGYMEVAKVVRSRTDAFAEGDVLASAYGHATAHVADPLTEHLVPLPAQLDPLLGVFVAHFGPICANGLLHAAADATGGMVRGLQDGVEGRLVLVTGAGPVGLMTALFASSLGAREVAVADSDPRRRQLAEALGFLAVDLDDDPGKLLKTRWRHGPGDRGADVVFQCRGRAEALHAALRAVRPQGTVVDLAFYTQGADAVRLGEEFHHNGLSLRCAQIGRTPRGLSAQWDRGRLSAETIKLLRSHGDLIRKHFVTDVVPFDDGPGLMHQVARRERHVITAVFAVSPLLL